MPRKRASPSGYVDLDATYGFDDDLSNCYRQLAARGQDQFDEEAATRLLLNHVTVRTIAIKFLRPRHRKLADLLEIKRKHEHEPRSAAQAREEAVDFLAWVFGAGRYGVLCDTARRARRWEEFPGVLKGGDGLRNLMFDYLRSKVRLPAFESIDDPRENDKAGSPRPKPSSTLIVGVVSDASAGAAAGAEPDAAPAPSWCAARHTDEIRSRVRYEVEHGQDRQRGLALHLLSLPYVGTVAHVLPADLRRQFGWLPPEAEELYARIRSRWLERLKELQEKLSEHLRRRQGLLVKCYESERTETKAEERKVWQARAEEYLHHAGRCQQEILHLCDKLADETDIQGILGLPSPREGRNIRKRAWRYLHQIIQEVTGRRPPTPSERRRMLAEEEAGPAVS